MGRLKQAETREAPGPLSFFGRLKHKTHAGGLLNKIIEETFGKKGKEGNSNRK